MILKWKKLQPLKCSVEASSRQKKRGKMKTRYCLSYQCHKSILLCLFVCDFNQTLPINSISLLSVTFHSWNFPYKICKTEYMNTTKYDLKKNIHPGPSAFVPKKQIPAQYTFFTIFGIFLGDTKVKFKFGLLERQGVFICGDFCSYCIHFSHCP